MLPYRYLAEFLKLCLEKAQDIRTGTGDCGKNFHGGIAVLVCPMVKLNPELTCHGVERGLHVNPCGGEGVAKAWYVQLVSLENQFSDHMCLL